MQETTEDGPWADLSTRWERIGAIVAVVLIVCGIVIYAVYAQTHSVKMVCDQTGCWHDEPVNTDPTTTWSIPYDLLPTVAG